MRFKTESRCRKQVGKTKIFSVMKNFNLILLSFFLVLNLNAQDIELTFTGSGAATTVEDVKVVYLSKGDTVDISGSDVLKLAGPTGIGFSLADDNTVMVYPNPMRDAGHIKFRTLEAGSVNLEIFDISGKLVVRSTHDLQSGEQTFSLSGLNQGLYTLRVSTPGHVLSARMVSVEKLSGLPVIRHENSEAFSQTVSTLKGSKATINLEYTAGDYILLKGKSGNHQRVVTIAPTESQAVNFEFVECKDADDNHYPIVTIGTQTWTAENLITTKFQNGTDILNIEVDALWYSTSLPGWSWVHNDESYAYYGKLYNWFVAGSDANPCPEGWHVPSRDEYLVLHYFLIDTFSLTSGATSDNQGWAGKSVAHIALWQEYLDRDPAIGNNPLLNNQTGFSMIPNGRRQDAPHDQGSFRLQERWAFNWLATENVDNTETAWHTALRTDFARHESWTMNKRRGAGIRCIKD